MIPLYLAYGLAFVALGVAALVYPTDVSRLPLARELWKLGAFGVLHGAHEWLLMLEAARALEGAAAALASSALLVGSFVFLFQFAAGLLGLSRRARTALIAAPALLFLVGHAGSRPADVTTLGRYLLALPGALLTALGLLRHAESLRRAGARHGFHARALAASFVVYGVAAGLVVNEPASFFPASVLNAEAFQRSFYFPIQLVRMLAGAAAAYSTVALLQVVRQETVARLREANEQLEDRVRERTADLEQSARSLERAMRERRELEAKLGYADRMSALGTLAAGMAHEVNNPLAYAMLNLEAARHDVESSTKALERRELDAAVTSLRSIDSALTVAHEGAVRIRDIVRDLRTLARSEEELRQAVDVREPLRFALGVANNEIRHRARVDKDLGEVRPVDANPGRLGQVFLNLLLNAAQAIPPGRDGQETIAVRCGMAGDRVFVEISDTGCGIPAGELTKIFEPFFTTKPVGLGTGLGLWICNSIVTELGGEITARSTVGEGTTFRVELPSVDAAPERSASREAIVAAPRRLSILVVDDEAQIGRVLARRLSPPHDVELETSGAAALARLEAGAAFDVILCDLMLPDLSGMALFEQLTASRPEVAARIVFMTGGAFTDEAESFLARVPNRWIDKPVDMGELESLLAELADRRRFSETSRGRDATRT